jgi:hypothetical protein
MLCSQAALCPSTGNFEMSVFQMLSAGNMGQLGAPGTFVPPVATVTLAFARAGSALAAFAAPGRAGTGRTVGRAAAGAAAPASALAPAGAMAAVLHAARNASGTATASRAGRPRSGLVKAPSFHRGITSDRCAG